MLPLNTTTLSITRLNVVIITIVILSLTLSAIVQAGDFTVITSYGGEGVVLSSDGNRAAWGQGQFTGFLWIRGEPAIIVLEAFPTFSSTFVEGISGNGTTVVGSTLSIFGNFVPGYWRNFAEPRVDLAYDFNTYRGGRAIAASTSGNFIVGAVDSLQNGGTRTIIWTLPQPSTTTIINPLPGDTSCFPTDISGDGMSVVGDSTVFNGQDIHRAFVYSASSNPQVQSLPPLPGDNNSSARGISRDGLWAFGDSHTTLTAIYKGVLWNTQTRSLTAIPNFYPGEYVSPLAINGDGTIVTGHTFDPSHSEIAVVIWRRDTGQMFEINELAASLGIDMDGWRMQGMQDINNDGHVFAVSVTRPLGGGTQIGTGILRIDCFDGPTIVSGPQSVATCTDSLAEFRIGVSGTGPFTFLWRKDSTSIDALANPTAATDTLTLTDIQLSEAGAYDCVVGNSCGAITSEAAILSVFLGGSGDGNIDGVTNGIDIQEMISILIAGGSPSAQYCAFDMNHDSLVDALDIPLFVGSLLDSS